MIFQWVFGIACALIVSPRAWAGSESQIHIHVWAAILLGGILNLFPVMLIKLNPGETLTRHVVAISQMLFSALLIHLMGGRIEAHFHVFGSLAFVAFYRDWRVLMSASIVVALDHFLRGMYWPRSVYGIYFTDQWRWLEHTAWVVFEDIFLTYACIVGVRDLRVISERRATLEESNREIEKLRLAAVEANQAKSAFLANMSHEIRTPLGAVLGFSQLLNESDLDEATRTHYMDIINRNGHSLASLIGDILDLSKVEAGRLEIEKTQFSLTHLLYDITESLKFKASENNVELHVEFAGDVPNQIFSDPTRLRQTLLNVVGNAIKFTNNGTVKIMVSATKYPPSIIHLEFLVEDTGRGLSEAEQKKLFQSFSQADASTTRHYGGTGLGLVLSQKLSRELGGDLCLVQSEPGKGSKFLISISAKYVVESKAQPIDRPQPQYSKLNDCLKGIKLLVAEDAVDNRLLIDHILSRAGAIVSMAENGVDAVEKAENGSFDLVLMDIQMPVMDGLQATKQLRLRGYKKPIIALTAHVMIQDQEECIAAGCDDYLAKPVNRGALAEMILKHTNRHQEIQSYPNTFSSVWMSGPNPPSLN